LPDAVKSFGDYSDNKPLSVLMAIFSDEPC